MEQSVNLQKLLCRNCSHLLEKKEFYPGMTQEEFNEYKEWVLNSYLCDDCEKKLHGEKE